MKLHRNAKTTPAQRLLIARRYLEEGWDVASLADAVGVSQRTVWKWIARYRAEGEAGLEDRSSRPARVWNRTGDDVVARVRALRERRLAAWQIAELLDLARSTVSAILTRLGLSRLGLLEPREPVRRYERPAPGELIHLDVKKLGRIKGIGHRIHGDRTKRQRGIGWEYVHVCIDDHSRVAYVEVLEDERGETAAGFLERAVRYFAGLGVQVLRALTDNGSCYRSSDFAAVAERLGVGLRRTRPYRPQTNGKAERLIQTLLREWAYAKPYRTSAGRRRALPAYLRRYNCVRRHGSLEFQPPMSRIQGAG